MECPVDAGDTIKTTLPSRSPLIKYPLRYISAENERLRTLHDQAVDTLINSEKDIDTSFDNRLIVLRDTLTEERKLRRHVELEIRSVKKMSSENLKELESTSLQLQSLKLVKDNLEKQNEKLKR
ncbi:hypothetical protein SNE40_020855 [Patella caerulea]|uniref:Uncharacterized protein n=1 Tax=Patella caerulea TaxID=87958 RepID=A0AAN8J669_PATCE